MVSVGHTGFGFKDCPSDESSSAPQGHKPKSKGKGSRVAKFGSLFTADFDRFFPSNPPSQLTIAFCAPFPCPDALRGSLSFDSSHFLQQIIRMAAVVSATSSVNKTRHCLACEKTAPEVKLFWCARCQQVSYCVRPTRSRPA